MEPGRGWLQAQYMMVEIWISNRGREEIHHFLDHDQRTYIFGFNRQLLGDDLYRETLQKIEEKLHDQRRNNPK
jgi:hypothetical protein